MRATALLTSLAFLSTSVLTTSFLAHAQDGMLPPDEIAETYHPLLKKIDDEFQEIKTPFDEAEEAYRIAKAEYDRRFEGFAGGARFVGYGLLYALGGGSRMTDRDSDAVAAKDSAERKLRTLRYDYNLGFIRMTSLRGALDPILQLYTAAEDADELPTLCKLSKDIAQVLRYSSRSANEYTRALAEQYYALSLDDSVEDDVRRSNMWFKEQELNKGLRHANHMTAQLIEASRVVQDLKAKCSAATK